MGVVLDSSFLIKIERGSSWPDKLAPSEDVFIAVVTVSELLHGVFRAKSQEIRQRRSAFVEGIIQNVPVLDIDIRVARSHAMLWANLVRKGKMIGIQDSWIAATCLAYGHKLATYNQREFKQVPELDIIEAGVPPKKWTE